MGVQVPADEGDKIFGDERLNYKRLRPRVLRALSRFGTVGRSDAQYRYVFRRGVRFQLATDFVPAHHRHHDVEQHDVRLIDFGHVQRADSIVGAQYVESLECQGSLK